jgi:uncharacterized repeat protein (TIGR03803 family)
MKLTANISRRLKSANWRYATGAVCAMITILLATQIPAHADGFKVIYNFCSETNCSDGALPEAPLGPFDGLNIYGTTSEGGPFVPPALPQGTIFKFNLLSGKLTTLFDFDETDGEEPIGLMRAFNGQLYGTTSMGGTNDQGTVYTYSNGTVTTLHSFNRHKNHDGDTPNGLIQAKNGIFYGTTGQGGTNPGIVGFGAGTVFQITSDGTESILYNFCSETDCADGDGPSAVIQGRDGAIYGTASLFGAYGNGTVFKITLDGKLKTLHSFNGTDGGDPEAALVQASDSNFYGTTSDGGTYNFGTVFRITSGGKLTTLHNFAGTATDGAGPNAALLQAWDGNLYGTTVNGGSGSVGTIFRITLRGKLTTLHSFNGNDGANPVAALIQGPFGILYGTTPNGGANGQGGTIFSLYATPCPAP